jgi:sulfotransferase
MTKVHLISGLPRSGSTLLSALLKQNPSFHASVTSPVATMIGALLPKMSGTSEFATFFSDETRYRILHGLFTNYHHSPEGKNDVTFDTSRAWTSRMSLVDKLFPDAKVICCVREVSWIIDSMERMIRKNPTHVSSIFNSKTVHNMYGRVENLMNTETGLIGQAWSSLREAWFGEHANKLIIVRYDTLTKEPEETLRKLYKALNEPYFGHDVDNVKYDENEYDERLGMPGLHAVKKRVEFTERQTVLPPDVFHRYGDLNFWTNEKLNTKGVYII